MLEYLKECSTNYLYERAMDCELKINSFNNISPMAEFFETALKAIYVEMEQGLSPKDIDHMKFVELHNDPQLTKYLEDVYGITGRSLTTISIIRRKSNLNKHSVRAAKAPPEEIKRYFQCIFDFSAHYYAVKTGKPLPCWEDAAYQAVLDSAVDMEARSKRSAAYEEIISQLKSELKQSENKDFEYTAEIERLKKQLDEQIFQNTDQTQLEQQQAHITDLENRLNASHSQSIRLSAKVEKAENEKKRAELELLRIQRQAEQAGSEQAEGYRREQAALEEKLRLAGQSLEELGRQNLRLQNQIDAVSRERDIAQRELYKLGRRSADQEKTAALERKLAKAQEDREQTRRQFQELEKRLSDAENQLFVARDEISRINQAYLDNLGNFEKLERPNCPICNSVMQPRSGPYGYFWGCSAWRGDGSGCDAKRKPSPSELPLFEQLFAIKKGGLKLRPQTLQSLKAKFVDFAAYPSSFASITPTAYLFQSLAVPGEIFPERDKLSLRFFSQFQMCCGMERKEIPSRERTVYSLTLRLLNRGIVLSTNERLASVLREKFNQKEMGCVNALFDYIRYDRPENPYGSDLEQEFAEYYFPRLLGQGWATYVISQAGFDAMVPDEGHFTKQRVDFLINKNNRRVVVELDGPEHTSSRDRDRDEVLARHGIQVLHFSNEAARRRAPEILEALQKAVGESKANSRRTKLDDHYLVACKLAHQFEICIVKALEQGYIPSKCNLLASVSTGLFSASEAQFILTAAAAEVQRLLENYAALYGLEAEWDFFDGESDTLEIRVGDGGGLGGPIGITLRDCYLPGNYQCDIAPFDSSALPANSGLETLEFFLEYLFGYPHFREGQYHAVCRLLHREDSIILLPTGAGKSIIFQLASFLVPGMIVVISPLRSLIEDQVLNLEWKFGINNAVPLMSFPGKDRSAQEEKLVRMQHNATSLLYIAPERLAIPSFRETLPGMMARNFVYAAALDEAHCISEWGHDFRPAYLNIGQTTRTLFRKGSYVPTLIALTGTASDAVLKDVQRELGILRPEALIVPATFDRSELHFRVVQCPSTDKGIHIAELVKKDLPEAFSQSYQDFIRMDGGNTNAGIVFTPLRTGAAMGQYAVTSIQYQLSAMLPEAGIAAYFSEEPEGYDRETWQATIRANASRFKKNERNLLVATKAFGMGIDKANIRYVIHNGIPSSFEAYYQEAGRAGRDRRPAECVLLFSSSNDEQNDELLDPSLTLQDFTERFSRYKSKDAPASQRDDLNAILFFHTNSYKGVDEECRSANIMIDRLSEKDFHTGHAVSFYMKAGREKDAMKKWRHALVRLSVLGVITDYTDNQSGTFVVTLGSIRREDVIKKYVAYVSWNSQGRTERERQKLEKSEKDGLAFVKEAVRALVEYIYDSIEQSRRRAIREMYMTAREAAALPQAEQDAFFRRRILDYFSYQGVQKDDLQEMLSADHAGVQFLQRLFPVESDREVFSEDDRQQAAGLGTAAGRMLESNPDHPGLLLAQASAEIIAGDRSANVIASNIAAAVRYAAERYSVARDVLEQAVCHTLDLALTSSAGLFETVLDSAAGSEREKKGLVEKMLSSDHVSDTNRNYLLYSYALDRANDFLTGGYRNDQT